MRKRPFAEAAAQHNRAGRRPGKRPMGIGGLWVDSLSPGRDNVRVHKDRTSIRNGWVPPEAYQGAHNVGAVGNIYGLGQVIAWAPGAEHGAKRRRAMEPTRGAHDET